MSGGRRWKMGLEGYAPLGEHRRKELQAGLDPLGRVARLDFAFVQAGKVAQIEHYLADSL